MRTLRQIAGEMEELATGGYGDVEALHSRADALLVEALRLAMLHGSEAYERERICIAWERVEIEKWYA